MSVALRNEGVGIAGIGFAALGCGITFIVARQIGSNLSEADGMALTKTISLGVIALLVVIRLRFFITLTIPAQICLHPRSSAFICRHLRSKNLSYYLYNNKSAAS